LIEKIDGHIYDPVRVVAKTIDVIEDRIANPQTGIFQGIPDTADFLSPWRIGELVGILAYTSNGKSSFMNYIVNQHAYKIRAYKESHPDYMHGIAYFTWEQSVEEQTILDLSRIVGIDASKIFKGDITKADMDKIRGEGAAHRESLPIWLVGHSVKDRRRERMSMDDVSKAVVWMEDTAGLSLDLIVIDYLQRVRRSPNLETREGFMEVVDRCKDLALRCPVMISSQAKRDVIERKDFNPGLDDSQETSNFEQSCDHMISLAMPKQIYKEGAVFVLSGIPYIVRDNLLIVNFLKQKFGPAPRRKAYYMGYGGTYLVDIPEADRQEAIRVFNSKLKDNNNNAKTDNPRYRY